MSKWPWFALTPRQIELILWQLVRDLGGEAVLPLPEDRPSRRVLFTDYKGELVVVANSEMGDA